MRIESIIMAIQKPPDIVGSQKLFERYLAASTSGEDPDAILDTLLVDYAQSVLKRVVRSRLSSLYTPQDAAELASEAMVELLGRLRGGSSGPSHYI